MTKKKATKKKAATTGTLSARSSKKIANKAKRKPGFEAALEVEAQAAELQQVEDEQYKNHSADLQGIKGAHADAPAGLPDKAHAGLVPVLKIPFAIWSNIEKIPEIRLSDEEAEEWGLPVTQLLEYYFPGKIPEIAWVWLMFLSSTGKVIDSRVKIRHEKSQGDERSPKAGREGPEAKPGPAGPPEHEGSEPAEGYPQE